MQSCGTHQESECASPFPEKSCKISWFRQHPFHAVPFKVWPRSDAYQALGGRPVRQYPALWVGALTSQIDVEEFRLSRHLALDGRCQPVGKRHLVVVGIELDLGQDQVTVPEFIDLPGAAVDVDLEAPLSEPVALRERPHREKDCFGCLFLDLGPRDALAELHGAIEVNVLAAAPVMNRDAPDPLLQPGARQIALRDVEP